MDHHRWIRPGESVFIPQGVTHRLSNPGAIPLCLVEVQQGEYLNEDDIVRLDDDYDRTNKKV
jgi:mannose-6-phosphate isomerase-like protein (cupin superfamily)